MQCPKCRSPDLTWKADIREDGDLKVERWSCTRCGSTIILTLNRLYNKVQLRIG